MHAPFPTPICPTNSTKPHFPTFPVSTGFAKVTALVGRQYGMDGVVSVLLNATFESDAREEGSAGAIPSSPAGIPIHTNANLTWVDQDAAPRTVRLTLPPDWAAHHNPRVVLRLRANLPLGAYPTLRIRLHCEPTAAGTFGLTETRIAVRESAGPVTLAVHRVNGTHGRARVELGFVASTGTPHIDFTLDHRVLTWADGESGVQHAILTPRPNHEHFPSDEVYLTLFNGRGARLPGHAPLLTVVITNDKDAPAHNLTEEVSGLSQVA